MLIFTVLSTKAVTTADANPIRIKFISPLTVRNVLRKYKKDDEDREEC